MTGRTRLSIAAALLAALGWAVVSVFDPGLDWVRGAREHWAAFVQQQPVASSVLFVFAYLLVAALALPGALLLTLLAGALFGLAHGVLLVTVGASLGALLALLLVRLLFRESFRKRFGDRLQRVERGIERDGAYYLFMLRLVPVLPFFLVNALTALTPIRAGTFYWVSLFGMLPATMVYVNAGTQLASLTNLAGLLSPGLLISLVLLGVFPLLAKGPIAWLVVRIRGAWRGRLARAQWASMRPRRFDRNLIVVGGGSAGLVAAYVAAALKARVTLIERDVMGGDCLNTGCVPSKALIRAARLVHQARHSDRWGIRAMSPQFEFADVMARVRETIQRVAPHDSPERYEALGVECIRGAARIVSPWEVELTSPQGEASRRLSARKLIIATGAEPILPVVPGIELIDPLSSDTVWALNELPSRLLVLGGGPIGCEMAQAFARLGARVTLVERGGRLLPREDADTSAALLSAFQAEGIEVLLHCELAEIRPPDGKPVARLSQSGEIRWLAFDRLFAALGRRARVEGAGLDALGLALEPDGTLQVDDWLQTSEPDVLACGDVASDRRFTHAASHMAWHASINALFGHLWPLKIDWSVFPVCTFVDPEIARVGLSEDEARVAGLRLEVTRYDLVDLDRAIIDGSAKGFIKVLTHAGSDRIVGASIVGDHAGELIAGFATAMRHRIGLKALLSTIVAYPTWSESGKALAGQWRREHASPRLLNLLSRYHTRRRR